VVRDHQEIERPGELDRDARRGDDLLAAGEAVGLLRAQPVAAHERIARVRGVMVGVAEVDVHRYFFPAYGE